MGDEAHKGLGQVNPTRDPWKHRSKGMLCQTCMYYVAKVSSAAQVAHSLGRCRRHAPTMSGYPAVFPHDWCGDHKLDEEKIT
jgi:hypothetical protein